MPTDALAAVAQLVDPTPYFDFLEDRFGLPPETFAGYVLVRTGKKKIYIVAHDHEPPVEPAPVTIGMPFMRTYLKPPKLSTAAAQKFGGAATRHVIDLDTEQAEAYLTRRDVYTRHAQLHRCSSRGYALVRYNGVVLGVGFVELTDEGGLIRCMLPKAWTRDAGAFTMQE